MGHGCGISSGKTWRTRRAAHGFQDLALNQIIGAGAWWFDSAICKPIRSARGCKRQNQFTSAQARTSKPGRRTITCGKSASAKSVSCSRERSGNLYVRALIRTRAWVEDAPSCACRFPLQSMTMTRSPAFPPQNKLQRRLPARSCCALPWTFWCRSAPASACSIASTVLAYAAQRKVIPLLAAIAGISCAFIAYFVAPTASVPKSR